jgi:hypothetical protein
MRTCAMRTCSLFSIYNVDIQTVYFLVFILLKEGVGARGSVVGRGTMLQVERSPVKFPMRSLNFSIDLIIQAALWPGGRLSL